MPILTIHLADGRYSDEQCEHLLAATSRFYAQSLKSPIERVRVFIQAYAARRIAVGGVSVQAGADDAPYFHFLVLEGRSVEERQHLLVGFTDLIVDILGVRRERVRGGCWPIAPENWAIGGVPASVLRAAEVAARSADASNAAV
ncbi:tautomerase family protein [Hydrocarboniphaga effusa]|uniref:tautomerase family protein n=1 Tax=Hydrocarboniphaga effusa TaxID=243629 RepID=UPI00398BCC26